MKAAKGQFFLYCRQIMRVKERDFISRSSDAPEHIPHSAFLQHTQKSGLDKEAHLLPFTHLEVAPE